MTNNISGENTIKDDELFTPQAWQDHVRRKIRTQTSWTIREDSRQEKRKPESANKNHKCLMKNWFLEDNEYGDDEEEGSCEDKRIEKVNDSSVEEKELFSGGHFDNIPYDLKKKSKPKDLRVSFKERVHLISPDIRKAPTTQRLKSGEDENGRTNSSLPFLENNTEYSKAVIRSKKRELGRSASAKVKSSNFNAHVDGTSMSRRRSVGLKGLQRFLPQVCLAQCNDFDSAVIEIVREYNDPCRGVQGESIDLYF